jgi:hypothetical protein
MSIRDRILARADLDGLRAAKDITGLAVALNADAPMEVGERFITGRTVLSECKDGADILNALAAAASIPAVEWALKFLSQNSGLDVGNQRTHDMIDQLQAGSALTPAQAKALKALSLRPQIVTQEQVADELYNPDGTEK